MTPEISEFSYGFALTNEVVGWSKLKAAPIFPSLIEEGKKGGGYDVKLDFPGIPLFLQFKRAHCMTRRTAVELSKHKKNLAVPFYRFHITDAGTSDQHMMLLELDDGQNQVFYAAPRFHRISEINTAWHSNAIASRSIFIRPTSIGALDYKAHHVAYDDKVTYLCSEPKLIESISAETLAAQLQSKLKSDDRPLRDKLPELLERANGAVSRALHRIAARQHSSAQRKEYEGALEEALALPVLDPSLRRVPSRTPEPLSPPKEQLRALADKAHTLFHSQLVVIQAEY